MMKPNITAGIDFGNQTSILSIPAEHGVDIILNESSSRKTPSIIGYQEGRRTSGEFAQQQQMMNISNTITQLKNLIGLKFDSEKRLKISSEVPFEIVRLENGLSGIKLSNGEILQIEQIIGFYLKSLIQIIQKKNPKIEQIVLTVPSNLTEIQRRSILNSAKISGVKIAELLENSLAAAISYTKIHNDRFPVEKDKGLNVLFIELGDSSMNASIAKISKKSIEMKSNVTDNSINGFILSEILENYLIEKVVEKYKINPKSNKRAMIRFNQACEKVKKTLSSNPVVLFEVPSLMNDIDVSVTIKRDEFNSITKDCLSRIKNVIEKAIENAEIKKEDISFVEIIGGSSRIPSIKTEIKEILGKDIKMSLDLDECFAIGAGFMASKIDGNDIGIDFINKNTCPYTINAKVDNESNIINVFSQNTSLPNSAKFTVPINQQQSIAFYSNQDEIGKLKIQTENQNEVEIEVSIDSFGIIGINNVKIGEKNVEFTYTPLMTLSQDEISKYQQIEEIQSKQDKMEIEIDNTKNTLESLIFSTENEIKEIKSNCVSESQKKLESIHNWFDENEFERLSLNEYKSKIIEIKEIMNEISKYKDNQKEYEMKKNNVNEIKQLLQKLFEKVTKDTERNQLQESVDLQNKISKLIQEVDDLMKSSKDDLIKVDINGLQKEVSEIENKTKLLSKIQIPKKKEIRKKRKQTSKRRNNQMFNEWSPFGMRNSIFDGFMGNPWQTQRYQPRDENEYEYEYSYDDDSEFENQKKKEAQILAQKQQEERKKQEYLRQQEKRKKQEYLRKQEEERKKQEYLRKQEEERKKQEYLRKQEEERKKQEYLRKQEEERKKQEYLRKQEEECKKQEYLRKQEEERKKQEYLRKQEEERKKQEYLRKQEEECKKQEYLRKQEEEKQKVEMEKRRHIAQIEQEKAKRSKENNYVRDNDDFSYLNQMKKESQIQAQERKQEQMQRQEQERQRQIEFENRKRAQIEQERIRRAKEAEIQRRQQAMNDPWSSSMFSPFGRTVNPQRQSVQPRQYQQQRRMIPGYPWGF